MRELPCGWANTTLDAVADWSSGGTPSRTNPAFFTGTIPWIKTGELGPYKIFSADEFISKAAISASSAKVFPQGSVALAMYGATIGKASILGIDAATNQACAVGTPKAVETEFLYYYLLSQAKSFVDAGKGGAQPNISQGIVKAWPIFLPPRAEQTRIVAKLEELLTDLDAGVAELKAAQKKLAQYRQSLLKAAVEGALTADWRAVRSSSPRRRGSSGTPTPAGNAVDSRLRGNDEEEESGAQLLARILQERRARWEARQLAKFASQGKNPPKDWQKKYPEPVQPNTTDLPELPKGWVWASVDMLGEIQGGIQKQPSRAPVSNNFPFLRVANVARGELRLDDVHEIELFPGELERLVLVTGDVLIVEGNGSLSEIGRCAVWNGSVPNAVHQNHLIRVRPILLQGHWLESWFNSPVGISKLTMLAATTSGLYTLSVGKIARIPVPVPPVHEQLQALDFLQSGLAGQSEQKIAITHALHQSTAQRQNILRAAFSGQLVPQNPADEPASALLERIRAERTAQTAAKKPRGRQAKEG